MALKAIALHAGVNLLHLAYAINVLGKNVLVDGIAGRAVDVQHVVFFVRARQITEEFPALLRNLAIGDRRFQLEAGPQDGAQRQVVEATRVEDRPLIVIAQQ